MKRIINTIITLIVLLVTGSVFAAALQPDQATFKGLSLSSNREKVLQVMGEPYRIGNWQYTNEPIYEYPGVNFAFFTKFASKSTDPLSKIIIDAPQAELDNGLKTGMSSTTVINKLGRGFGYDSARDEMVYSLLIDPVNYTLGFLTIQLEGDVVKRIIVERTKD